jgi:hypothetical protein
VSSYIGMVPKPFDSGETKRAGRITRHGRRLVLRCWWKLPGLRCGKTAGRANAFNASGW